MSQNEILCAFNIIDVKKGIDTAIVMITISMIASARSGWYPQVTIITTTTIIEASNVM